MEIPILNVDTNLTVWERESDGWQRNGKSLLRVDSMRDAIERLCRGSFLLVTINADCISYLPLLPVMRELVETPIFVITSHFTVTDQVKALQNGADEYAPFRPTTDDNVQSALALLQRILRRKSNAAKPIIHRGLIIDPDKRKVLVDGHKLALTPLEYGVMLFLASNIGRPLSKEHIYSRVWEVDNCEDAERALSYHVVNLKRKIAAVTSEKYIHTEWSIGYRLE